MFEKIYNVFCLTDRGKTVWCLIILSSKTYVFEDKMSMYWSVGLVISLCALLYQNRSRNNVCWLANAYRCSYLLMHLEVHMFDIPPSCCIMNVSLSAFHVSLSVK